MIGILFNRSIAAIQKRLVKLEAPLLPYATSDEYTLRPSDNNKVIFAYSNTVNVPPGLPPGFRCSVAVTNDGNVDLNPGSGVNIGIVDSDGSAVPSVVVARSSNGLLELVMLAQDSFWAFGNVESVS